LTQLTGNGWDELRVALARIVTTLSEPRSKMFICTGWESVEREQTASTGAGGPGQRPGVDAPKTGGTITGSLRRNAYGVPDTGEGLKDVRGRQLQLITILGGQTITATLEGLWTDIGPTGLHLVAQGRGAGQNSRRTPSVELTFTSNLRMHRLVQLVSIKACACDKLI
jgi:hypothetical protein